MGFEKVIVREGDGSKPTKGREVTVHCTGYGKNNDLNVPFWSTKDPGQKPFSFTIGLGQVIKGWDEGVMTMVCFSFRCFPVNLKVWLSFITTDKRRNCSHHLYSRLWLWCWWLSCLGYYAKRDFDFRNRSSGGLISCPYNDHLTN